MSNTPDEKSNFLDSKTIWAIVLVGLVWFGWQTYLQKKYPDYNKPIPATEEAKKEVLAPANPTTSIAASSNIETAPQVSGSTAEALTDYSSENVDFKISNRGMGIRDVHLHKFTERSGNPILLGRLTTHQLFEVNFVGRTQPLMFNITRTADNEFVGRAEHMGMTVVRTMKIDGSRYAIENNVKVENINSNFQGLNIFVGDLKEEYSSGNFLVPSFEHQDFVVQHNGDVDRVNVSTTKEPISSSFERVDMVGIGNQYFTVNLVDHSDTLPHVNLIAENAAKTPASAILTYKPATQQPSMNLTFLGYTGPKSLDILKMVDPSLAHAVNLGFFKVLAKPMISVMKYFFSLVGNWGVAIILLTLLVRLLVMPFTLMSFKSMKAMQKIQPALASLRERYKNDPQTLNREMMGMMKQHKVNPLGGCLPMLLQIPIFIALYQVIGQSIELYQAPFIFWIHDLSIKDPFYVLPVLMGITMFIQQKITPSTMDATQQKIMMVLPVVFSLFMIALPSGLTLYIFVSTLFGIVQQFLLMRDKTPATVAISK